MRRYKCIDQIEFSIGNYSLVPIRDEDKYQIMSWRNEQMEVLRQSEALTIDRQEWYFKNVVDKLFDSETPNQLLFSFLENKKLIGYGGLVHIDWQSKSAEISFLTETGRSHSSEKFINDWVNYLVLLKEISNNFLNFNFIFTYAYDIRPNLYIALERCGFKETNRIKNHVLIAQVKRDVVIHSLKLSPLKMEYASAKDVQLYFEWANDLDVRKNSFQTEPIAYKDHEKWFASKLTHPDYRFYLFKNEQNQATGQVRISKTDGESVIGISIDSKHRGKGYGTKMLRMACNQYFGEWHVKEITAYIKVENTTSLTIFKRAGFIETEKLAVNGFNSLKLVCKNEKL